MRLNEKYKFKHSETIATKDRAVLIKWDESKITTSTAMALISENNGWEGMTLEEFIEIAEGLGYYRRTYHNRMIV